MLLHLVDATAKNIETDYLTVREELIAYGAGLEKRDEIVALSKCDALDEDTIEEQRQRLAKASGKKTYVVSAVSGRGIDAVLFALKNKIDNAAEHAAAASESKKAWQP